MRRHDFFRRTSSELAQIFDNQFVTYYSDYETVMTVDIRITGLETSVMISNDVLRAYVAEYPFHPTPFHVSHQYEGTILYKVLHYASEHLVYAHHNVPSPAQAYNILSQLVSKFVKHVTVQLRKPVINGVKCTVQTEEAGAKTSIKCQLSELPR